MVSQIILKSIIPFVIVLVSSCATSMYEKKLSPLLSQKLTSCELKGSEELITIIGKCSSIITDEMTSELTSTGIVIESIVDDIFTAQGSPSQIRRIIELEFVISLDLSIERNILQLK